jgi:hypothetical protein
MANAERRPRPPLFFRGEMADHGPAREGEKLALWQVAAVWVGSALLGWLLVVVGILAVRALLE